MMPAIRIVEGIIRKTILNSPIALDYNQMIISEDQKITFNSIKKKIKMIQSNYKENVLKRMRMYVDNKIGNCGVHAILGYMLLKAKLRKYDTFSFEEIKENLHILAFADKDHEIIIWGKVETTDEKIPVIMNKIKSIVPVVTIAPNSIILDFWGEKLNIKGKDGSLSKPRGNPIITTKEFYGRWVHNFLNCSMKFTDRTKSLSDRLSDDQQDLLVKYINSNIE